MSAIEYRNLLYEISQEVNWLSESQRLLFICEGFIGGGSEHRIRDVLSLFKELQEQKNLGIDNLQLPKEIVKGIGKWNLLERIKKFEIKREEFRALLETVSRVLAESGHLERLVAICKGRIAEERENTIENARALLTELENNNALAVGQVGILKTLVGEDRPDLLQQVEEFERKREQEETTERKIKESEDAKRRRKAQAVAVLSSAKYAGERLIGTVTPYCTFRNVAGATVIVTTRMILRKSTNLEEFVTSFTEAVLPAANTLRAISEGSICFTIQAENSSALEALWKQYQDGVLRDKLQEFLVTDDYIPVPFTYCGTAQEEKPNLTFISVVFSCPMIYYPFSLKVEENVLDRQRSRPNSDSVVYTTEKENDVPAAVFPQTKEKTHLMDSRDPVFKCWRSQRKVKSSSFLSERQISQKESFQSIFPPKNHRENSCVNPLLFIFQRIEHLKSNRGRKAHLCGKWKDFFMISHRCSLSHRENLTAVLSVKVRFLNCRAKKIKKASCLLEAK
ncbi:unnamed protein product [Porites evermanni]|uniref:DED domain-containing protein n=1 Tax=Porites evermanni TaxID=104178 RepID=A0ABN8LDY6_9CNID|nr:unnamed protein product [Porites evermanni]